MGFGGGGSEEGGGGKKTTNDVETHPRGPSREHTKRLVRSKTETRATCTHTRKINRVLLCMGHGDTGSGTATKNENRFPQRVSRCSVATLSALIDVRHRLARSQLRPGPQ